MARVKITEFQAKTILSDELGLGWAGISADVNTTHQVISTFGKTGLVIKVDQGIKKRGKQGLVGINFSPEQCIDFIKEKSQLGYTNFIVENLLLHEDDQEHYLSLERVREGYKVIYSETGGVDVEQNFDAAREFIIPYDQVSFEKVEIQNKSIQSFVIKLIGILDKYYFSFLEINPLVIKDDKIFPLDFAVEVDDATLSLQGDIEYKTFREAKTSEAELKVQELDEKTPASLKFKIINPDGQIWMLLSGGGASLVLADEIADIGFGQELGNYGEYSGNPTREDTYMYTKIIIDTMLKSKAKQKVIIIAGGVANFTDVAKTFAGIIDALDEFKDILKKNSIKVYVRRGGPNQEKGLAIMREFLENAELYGSVTGPEFMLTDVVKRAVAQLTNN